MALDEEPPTARAAASHFIQQRRRRRWLAPLQLVERTHAARCTRESEGEKERRRECNWPEKIDGAGARGRHAIAGGVGKARWGPVRGCFSSRGGGKSGVFEKIARALRSGAVPPTTESLAARPPRRVIGESASALFRPCSAGSCCARQCCGSWSYTGFYGSVGRSE